ncbi:unnamed protein product [Larinioides sclopetarius]|uniref:Uncharacterized protein n=1 Tax=Larinioides sclopetarius TaxID=280406 RepID=A0AAV1YTP8_9ARAC
MINHDAISTVTSENDVTLRNITNHSYHVTAVQISLNNASAYGVVGNVLDLQQFDSSSWPTPSPSNEELRSSTPSINSASSTIQDCSLVDGIPNK